METLEDPIAATIGFLQQEWVWIAQVFLVVFFTLSLAYLQRIVTRRLQVRVDKRAKVWDRALLETARRPVSLVIWLVGLSLAAGVVAAETGAPIFEFIEPVRNLGIVIAGAWWLIAFSSRFEELFIEARTVQQGVVDRTAVEAVGKLVRAAIIITAILVSLQNLGVNLAGLITFGGVGGIIVGFAAKDLLANFFGGLMVYMDRPFEVGDWVRSPDREIEGTVEHIGWRLTRIRTFDKRPLYIPNAAFSNIAVENPSRMTHRRISETIGIRYDDARVVRPVVDAIRAMVMGHPELDTDETVIVHLNRFGDSSLDIMLYCFTRTRVWVEFHRVKEDVLMRVNDIVAEHGAEIAFPTRTLHMVGEGSTADAADND